MSTAPKQPPPSGKTLPQAIVEKLESVIRRIRRVMLLRGLLGLAAAMLATLLVLMAVDAAVVFFSEAARWLLTLGGLAVILAAAAWFISRPLRWKISLAAIAQVVETQHPELQERISSTVELRGLTGSGEVDGQRSPGSLSAGSEELIAALAEEATVEAGHVDPRKEVSTRSARPFLLAAAALAGVLGLIFAIWPRHASVVLARVVAPGMNLGNVYSVNLRIQPGNRTVAIGDAVSVEASAASPQDLSDAVLETIDATGHVGRQKAPPAIVSPDQAVVAWNFPAVMSGFRYRVHAGRALSEYYRIDAVPRPQLQAIEVRYDYPAYTALKPRTFQELPATVEAVVGTRVTLTATMTQPIARWQVQLNGKPWAGSGVVAGANGTPLEPPVSPGGHAGFGPDAKIDAEAKKIVSWSFSLEPEMAGHVAMAMEDPHAISCDPLGFEVRAIPDGPPTIAIVDPKESKLTRKPQDRLTIGYQAQDDFGLSAIEMLVRLDAGEPTVVAQPMPDDVQPPLSACRGQAVLDLSQLDLRQARQVTVMMGVRDTLPESLHGPHQATSKPLVIEIDHSGETPVAEVDPAEAARAAALAKEAQELQKLAQEQQQAAEQAKQAEQAAEKADPQAASQSPDAEWQKQQDKLANEMADEVKKDPQAQQGELKSDQKQAQDLAANAQKLADEEKGLQQQSQALADAQADREKLKQAILDRLAQEQKRLADQAGQVQAQMKAAADVAKSDPANADQANADQAKADQAKADQVAAAQQEMNKSADELAQHNAADAAQQAHQAEKQLEASAASQPLTDAEKKVAEALDDVNKGALDSALEKMQQEVQQQADQVKAEAQDLAARAEAVNPDQQAQQAAQQAADQLGEAGRQSQQAEQSLAQAQKAADQAQAAADKPQEAAQAQAAASQADKAAGQSQAKAADALQQAAGDLRKLGDELGRQADAAAAPAPAQGSPEEKSLASALDKALDSASEAAHAPDKAQASAESAKAAHDAAQAAQAAQRAATSAQAQAVTHGKAKAAARQAQFAGKPGKLPGTMPAAAGSKMNQVAATSPPAPAETDPGKLKLSDKPETDWAKFQGKVNRGAQDDHAKNTPEEYRDLVNRYFEELARQGGRPEGKGK